MMPWAFRSSEAVPPPSSWRTSISIIRRGCSTPPSNERDHMSSDDKISANRINATKSTGPRSARGKSRASRNARRHGWAVKRDDSTVSADVERMAKALCGDNTTPALYEQAIIIAECQLLILKLRAAGVAAMERNRIAEPKPEK